MTRFAENLPLPALVGLDAARQGLLLLAVEPALRGVVLAAPAGSGKSSLARSFRALLGDDAPFVEVPLGVDDDGLLGGLDIEATLRKGTRVARSGALARAHGGTLYVDALNLLADSSANHVLGALDRGDVRLEREGLSLRVPADFRLIGSYDPAEGVPRRHLLDRVGLLIVLPPAADEQARVEVVRRNLFDDGRRTTDDGRHNSNHRPSSSVFRQTWSDELELLRGLVAAAHEHLPRVQIADAQVAALASASLAFGVEGQRADLFAVLAARAAAALELRDEVEDSDLELAVRLVIMPRATRVPTPEERAAEPQEQRTTNQEPQDREPGTGEPENREPRTENQKTENQEAEAESDTEPSAPMPENIPEEQVFATLIAELPFDLNDLPFRMQRRGRSGSRGATSGNRGRHVRSASGDPRRARIDIAATLRAAAPWQRMRSDQRRTTGDQSSPPPQPLSSLVIRPSSPQLRADDLRVKQFRSKAGALFLFAVDASGSMALNRMRHAKGAIHALLQQAYVQRDRVALLSFRGNDADLLLPPSQSVELARRALDLLPTGGGTPLAAALLRALDVAQQARGRGILQTVLVLLTDGRGNIGLRGPRDAVEREVQLLGGQVAAAGIHSIVVDTQRSYLSAGAAQKLAGWLSGQYVYLPNASGEQIAHLAMDRRHNA